MDEVTEERRVQLAGQIDASVWEELTCLADCTEHLDDKHLSDALRWIVRSAYCRGRCDARMDARLR